MFRFQHNAQFNDSCGRLGAMADKFGQRNGNIVEVDSRVD
jgi:hypothetical protein